MAERIGLDLGTTSLTGVLVDTAGSVVRRVARRPNDSALPAGRPTRAEQDALRLRALALDILAELAEDGAQVAGIGVTGQMHGLLCIDEAGEPLGPLVTWQDRRTTEPLPDGSTDLDALRALVADLRWQDNGCQIAHGYGAASLFWLARHRALPPGTARVCSVPDWVAGNLADRLPATDPTLACSWGMYSLVDNNWNGALVERLGLPAVLLPPLLPSGEPLGGLALAIAAQVGLTAGIPVHNALGDHPASFLASVDDPSAAVQVNLGTGGQVAWWVPAFEPPDERVETHPFTHGFIRMGASLCGGAAYAWLNRTVRAWLAEFGLHLNEEAVYRRLNALAQGSAPGRLRVKTTFLGVRGDPAVQGGAIDGIDLDNLSLGPLARATLHGLIDELRELYVTRAPAGHRLLAASGNGVQKNPLLPGLLAERFGLPVELPRWAEPAAVGAALVGL